MADGGAAQAAYDVLKALVSGWLWPRFKCHLDYWRRFRRNVEGLRDEIARLKTERDHMDQKVEAARLRAETPTTEIQAWKIDGDQKLEHAAEILRGCEGHKSWKIISRYSWGKKAKKTADKIAKFRDGAKEIIRISDPAPIRATAPIHHEPAMKFDSRRRIEEDVMQFLKDKNVSMVAICGAGGVGKTTMVRIIEDRAREEKLFDEVVHVVISQRVNKLEIQKKIAGWLGLELIEDDLDAQAYKLRIRLQDSKRKLIVFDDVWECLKLGDIGVPFGNGCKIILTSRVTYACKEMGAEKIIQMDVLTEQESWNLFKKKAGRCVEDPDLLPIAEAVAAECKGLPVALVSIGVALKDRSLPMWRNSLSQLKRSMPTDIPHFIRDVYTPLKLSYDFLENESLKSLFLLCCMFPEDYDIPIEHLTLYGIGLDMFEGIKNIDEGRDKTHAFMEELNSRFVLLDGSRSDRVKMHDVVRDVAIYIGSKEKNGFLKCPEVSSKDLSINCNWMSTDISIENPKITFGSNFPKLRLMMIRNSKSPDTLLDANGICFQGMEGLNVLSFSYANILTLPPTLKLLKKLTTLQLDDCEVKDISLLGELPRLEILDINYCYNIEELPTDIGRLKRLRSLAIYECPNLEKIAAGVISSLVGLEELKIHRSFNKWELKGNQSEEKDVRLSELESLPNLTCLEIQISDYNLFKEDICLPQQLARFKIHYRDIYEMDYGRAIQLFMPRDFTTGNWVCQLVRSTQSLVLEGDGSNNINVDEIGCLRDLFIQNCSTVKKLVNAVDGKFLVLESLRLKDLTELEEIVEGAISKGSNSFQNLKSLLVTKLPKLAYLWSSNQDVMLGNLQSIDVTKCDNLRHLFSMETARSLVQLKSLEISDCAKMEQVLWSNEMEISNTLTMFPNLEELRLRNLPNLLAFSKGVEIIESLHRLTSLTIIDCPKLMITKMGKYPDLRTLRFYNFHAPKHLLLSSQHTIEELSIYHCESIEEILWDELGEGGHIIFSELYKLRLANLPCFTTFCRDTVENIKFPKLKQMQIRDLDGSHEQDSLHFFCSQKNITLGKLQSIYISECDNLCRLFSMETARSLVQLTRLEIRDCAKMEQVLWNNEMEISNTLTMFPNLDELRLWNLPNLSSFSKGVEIIESLHRLESLIVIDCPKLMITKIGKCPHLRRLEFSNFHAPNHLLLCSQHTIEILSISDCESIEEILWDESGHIIFSQLTELTLSNLPCFTTFCRDTVESIKLPKLREIVIDDCPKLKSFLPMDLDGSHDNDSLPFFCSRKIEIPSLRILTLSNLLVTISKIWCCHIPINFFHNVEELYISNINGISNLISASTAKNLVNLKRLSIWGCHDMVDVIEDETEISSTPLFPKLKIIYIGHSRKLRSFCQWKHTLELPSLEDVEIIDCPCMETFTLGSLSTPSLSKFKADMGYVKTKNLNDNICAQFRIKTENIDGDDKEAEAEKI